MIGELLAELVGEAAFGRLGRSQPIRVALRVGFGLLGTFLGVAGAVHFWRTPGSISNSSLHASMQGLFAFLACFSLFNIALERSWRWPGAGFVLSFVALFATRILCGP